MKKFLKIILSVVIILFITIMSDLYFLRGNFTPKLFNLLNKERTAFKEIQNKDCELRITKEGEFYKINFKNNSYKPFFVWTYRWEDPFFKVNDSIFYRHLRYKSYFPKYINEYHYGLDCGSGAGEFAIKPYESFKVKKSYKELINFIYWRSVHQFNSENDTIKDLIHNKPLLLTDRRKEFKIFKRTDLTEKDSTDIQLYIPLFNASHKKLFYVKSNKIKLSYRDIIENLTNSEKETHEEFKMF